MTTATFVKAARKPIYRNGKKVEYISKKGKKEGQVITKIDRTQPRDDKDEIFIGIGESYYHWSFMYGGTHYSRTEPKRSQLTNSPFLSQYYALEESIQEASFEPTEDGYDELIGFGTNLLSELEEMRDQAQESLDAMPEHLQESSTAGETLQERIEHLDELISEIENFDFESFEAPDMEDEDVLKEIADEEGVDTEDENWQEQITQEMKDAYLETKYQEFIDEKMEELGGLSFSL